MHKKWMKKGKNSAIIPVFYCQNGFVNLEFIEILSF